MSGGSSTPSEQTQVTEPPAFQKPYLLKGFNYAEDAYDNAASASPNQLVPSFDSATKQAHQMIEQRALNGSPLNSQASGLVGSTLQGDYLSAGNPYFGDAFNASMQPVFENYTDVILPQIDSRFARAGRFNSAAQDRAMENADQNLMETMVNTASRAAFDNYNQERGMQQQAISLAPMIANQDYVDAQALSAVGGQREAKAQDMIDARYQQPFYNAQNYMGLVGGNFGNNTIQKQSFKKPSALASYAGGALSGGALGAMVGGPLGAGLGAGIAGGMALLSR